MAMRKTREVNYLLSLYRVVTRVPIVEEFRFFIAEIMVRER